MKTVARITILAFLLADAAHGAESALDPDNHMDPPLANSNHTGENIDKYPELQLQYDKQCQAFRSVYNSKYCDFTYAAIEKRYVEFSERTAAASGQIQKGGAGDCSAQNASQECVKKTSDKARDTLTSIGGAEGEAAKNLRNNLSTLLTAAKKSKDTIFPDAQCKAIATDQLTKMENAQAETDPNHRRTPYVVDICGAAFKNSPCDPQKTAGYCQALAAALEARYYAQAFQEKSDINLGKAGAAQRYSDEAERRRKGLGDDPDNKKSGLFGLDFKDWLGLGMLGVMAGGAYCSATGKCTSKGGGSSVTDPTLNGDQNQYEKGATSPTPESKNTGKTGLGDSSQTGDSKNGTAISNGASGTLAKPPVGNTVKYSVPEGDSAPAASNSASGSQGFQSSFERNLASPFGGSYAPAGGIGANSGGGGGLLANNSDGASTDPGAKLPNGDSSTGAGGPGFSLGGPGSSSADAALKSILNGDTPPGTDAAASPNLDGILDAANADPALAQEGHAQTASAESAADGQSIFSRVKETHVRCLKRGCVTFGIGKNI